VAATHHVGQWLEAARWPELQGGAEGIAYRQAEQGATAAIAKLRLKQVRWQVCATLMLPSEPGGLLTIVMGLCAFQHGSLLRRCRLVGLGGGLSLAEPEPDDDMDGTDA